VKVLSAAGVRVTFPEGQTCCGAPARYSGAADVAARNARDNVKALTDPGVRWIVSACPTCTVALRHDFASVLQSDGHADWVDRAHAVAAKVRDFSSLVKELVDAGRLSLDAAAGLPPLTYHDSCHLKRKLHAHEPPRELLGAAGYGIREMKDSDVCCGMGGSYTLKFPEISAPILARKLENVKATGVDTVAMDCPGCMMQIGGGLDRAGSGARTRHVAELLADRLRPAPATGGSGGTGGNGKPG
jgi:Fe-S oxidoreductase